MSDTAYRFGAQVLISDRPLPELEPVGDGRNASDIRIQWRKPRPPHEPREWRHHWSSADDRPVLSLADSETGRLLRFPEIADFEISADNRVVSVIPLADVSEATMRHLLLDQVLPRVVATHDSLSIHGAALLTGYGTVGLIADTGRGKSTLTASLMGAGARLLTDDGFVATTKAGRVQIVPLYTSLRLLPDSLDALYEQRPRVADMADYSRKQRVLLSNGSADVSAFVDLRALFVLEDSAATTGTTVTATPLSPRDACLEIVKNAFLLDPTDVRAARTLLEMASQIAASTPVFGLCYPRAFDALPDVRSVILERLRSIAMERHSQQDE